MAATDAYYDSLFGASAGATPFAGSPVQFSPGAGATKGAGLLGKLASGAKKHKGAIGSVLGFMLLQKLLETANQGADRQVQKEGMQAQAGLATPENLYYQAAQPQARQEAEMARSAFLSQITGGVIGPSLAPGERRI